MYGLIAGIIPSTHMPVSSLKPVSKLKGMRESIKLEGVVAEKASAYLVSVTLNEVIEQLDPYLTHAHPG
jgi:hypothetical protein